ncbi:hypothetical protein HBZC1_p0120 (plasmid) [Helicobacter bizzozeronii CIII-1]|uniref:Uncharacterized protein n=1 Tax=Helicobacter bizzozeronii (strain CIII-1) TaxID=1002804 RepID=F8KUF7_HELBC|nr:hypothetical protein HBZC1_p0120 [Helicobacter bizzozeronii CIII-1]
MLAIAFLFFLHLSPLQGQICQNELANVRCRRLGNLQTFHPIGTLTSSLGKFAPSNAGGGLDYKIDVLI